MTGLAIQKLLLSQQSKEMEEAPLDQQNPEETYISVTTIEPSIHEGRFRGEDQQMNYEGVLSRFNQQLQQQEAVQDDHHVAVIK